MDQNIKLKKWIRPQNSHKYIRIWDLQLWSEWFKV